MKALSSLE